MKVAEAIGTYRVPLTVATYASGAADLPPDEWILRVRDGLPFSEFRNLQVCLDLTEEKLAQAMGVARATIQRRRGEGKLTPEESDRLLRFARLMRRARQVLGELDLARQWLTTPQYGLGEETPLAYAGTEVGAREVELLLGRMEYGIY